MARMNPSDFVNKYLSMNVFVIPPGGEPKDVKWGTQVSVKRYHLGVSDDLRLQIWNDVKAAFAKGTTVKVETIVDANTTIPTYRENDAPGAIFQHAGEDRSLELFAINRAENQRYSAIDRPIPLSGLS